MATTLTPFPLPAPGSPAAPGPHARIARLIAARGWTAATVYALFDGLAVEQEFPAGIARAVAQASRP